ncbi:hypothetical protein DRQ11_02150, partial [candidate division KSB1 bacterium]
MLDTGYWKSEIGNWLRAKSILSFFNIKHQFPHQIATLDQKSANSQLIIVSKFTLSEIANRPVV